MEVNELMREYEAEIERPWLKNKMAFLKMGFTGEFEAIREVVRFKKPEPDDVDAVISLCDSRLDRLKSFSSDLMTFLSIALATFTFGLYLSFDKYGIYADSIMPFFTWYFKWEYIPLKIAIAILWFLTITCAFQFLRYRAQTNAWYAIKEGLLLERKNS